MKFDYPFGATPLDGDEAALLIPKHITTMSELNAFEHANILMAEQWAVHSRFNLSVSYMKKLHARMFDQTWKWAGQFRRTGKNIGVDAYRIETELQQLNEDALYQIDNKVFEFDGKRMAKYLLFRSKKRCHIQLRSTRTRDVPNDCSRYQTMGRDYRGFSKEPVKCDGLYERSWSCQIKFI